MADEPDNTVVGAPSVQDIEDLVEGVFVEAAEAFVDEVGVQWAAAGFVGDDIGQGEGQGQGDEEGFTSGEGVGVAGVAVPGVDDLQAGAGSGSVGGLLFGVDEVYRFSDIWARRVLAASTTSSSRAART
ncbi:hypothetical protein [Streptomyces sp. SID13588]|uniref:hypothetical protein n=1 Tax=Streptomyces sp. SID13588 TaxID=2706051 RepID=UPI001EF35676|nr:hypothetical protein [Streptomyces sp. SID13588]